MNRDPIAEHGGLNLYRFGINGPINGVDPLGQWFVVDDIVTGPVDEIIVIGGLAILGAIGVKWAQEAAKALGDIVWTSSEPDCRDPKCKDLEKRYNQAKKGAKSYRDLYKEHVKKLDDYVKDPLKYDNKGTMQKLIDEGNMDTVNSLFEGRQQRIMKDISKRKKEFEKKIEEAKKLKKLLEDLGC